MQHIPLLPGECFTMDDYELPLEEQATHADHVTATFCKNVDWCKEQLAPSDDYGFEDWNVTSLGNLAFLALHGPDTSVREQARKLHGRYVQWRRHIQHVQRQRKRWLAFAAGFALGFVGVFGSGYLLFRKIPSK